MVALNDLHRRLHSHDNKSLTEREKSPDDYNTENIMKAEDLRKEGPETVEIPKIEKKETTPKIEKEKPGKDKIDEDIIKISDLSEGGFFSDKKKLKIIGIAAGILILIIGITVGCIKYKQSAFSPEKVFVEIQGNTEVKSGGKLTCKMVIYNKNRVALNDVAVKVSYPENLVPDSKSFISDATLEEFYINIDSIEPANTREYELSFGAYSAFGNQVYLNTEVNYAPEGFSGEFTQTDNHSFLIKGSEISFSLVSQQEASSGELLKFVGVLTNNTVNDYDNLILEMNYSEGFNFVSSELEKIEGDVDRFRIPTLKAGEKKEVNFLGAFLGQTDSVKNAIGTIGLLKEGNGLSKIVSAEESIKIVPSKIAVTQEIVAGLNDDKISVNTGKTLKYRISFKNNSSSPLLDLILKEKLEGDLIDTSSIEIPGGYYDQSVGEIIWKASDVSALKVLNPGESGSVEFQYGVKTDFIENDSKNQSLITKARISSSNIETVLLSNKEISSENKEIKVATNLDLEWSGSHGSGVFKNSGPLPIKSGEETTFTLKLTAKNTYNKIRKPTLTIKLPSGIIWKNNFHRSSGSVTFNERTNELTWTMNYLNPGTGYESPTEELIFQIGLIPQSELNGEKILLVNDAILNGYEEFIGVDISRNTKEFRLNEISDYEF